MYIYEKLKQLTGTRLFFAVYLILFAVTLIILSGTESIFEGKIVKTDYRIHMYYEYWWTRAALIAMTAVHFCGGIAFFIKLCCEKLDLK